MRGQRGQRGQQSEAPEEDEHGNVVDNIETEETEWPTPKDSTGTQHQLTHKSSAFAPPKIHFEWGADNNARYRGSSMTVRRVIELRAVVRASDALLRAVAQRVIELRAVVRASDALLRADAQLRAVVRASDALGVEAR